MIVEVFRSSGSDCTNGGVSSRADVLHVLNVPGLSPPRDPRVPFVALVSGYARGTARLVPCDGAGRPLPGRWAFGGNFAHSSDSRWREAVERVVGGAFCGAVAIHDRREGPSPFQAHPEIFDGEVVWR